MEQFIKVRGARVHNLKNIDCDMPKNKLVVFTGLSGSGKSSLAFDTIYAEGQRRYVESLSAYARQFIGMMEKPDVDKIDGLSPAISIDQKSASHNPRSTVGTITEIYDYLRLLFARIGHPHCPSCGREISSMSVTQIVDAVLARNEASRKPRRFIVLSPLVEDRKGEYSQLFEDLRKKGYSRVRVDKQIKSVNEDFLLIKTNKHSIEAVIDRVTISLTSKGSKAIENDLLRQLTNAIETALKLSNGKVIVSEILDDSFDFPDNPKKFADHLYSEHFSCPYCNLSLPDLEPRSFSFNSPHGACPTCTGLGFRLEVDAQRIINPNFSINEGGILPWSSLGEEDTWRKKLIEAVAKKYQFSLDEPIEKLPEKIRKIILYGVPDEIFLLKFKGNQGLNREYEAHFEGLIPNMERRYKETDSDWVRVEIEKFMIQRICEACQGSRLRPETLSVTIDNHSIAQISSFDIEKLKSWLNQLEAPLLTEKELTIGKSILKELQSRLKFLLDVGLDYLTIDRGSSSLSGGEAQRIRLASQIGSGLSGVLYVLDEPSIGLHARDQGRLINTLKDLRDLGNTVIVVEHDSQTMLAADYIFDFGPGAGEHGGKIVAQGTAQQIMDDRDSLTGQYLSGRKKIEIKRTTNIGSDPFQGSDPMTRCNNDKLLIVRGATEHNLKNIDVSIPLGKFVGVSGVSGSGKSTLVMDILFKALAQKLYSSREIPGKYRIIEGVENIDKVVNIDQSPIGRTPRSNPATYTGVFAPVRDLFANLPEARARGYQKGRFSFNVKGGRCENCQGDGTIKIEMQFLPDVYVTCEVCKGLRFNRETLEIEFKNKNISDVLQMTVEEALDFFRNIPQIKNKLKMIIEVGLGYVRLGQAATTLSGGEAQRVKLSSELSKRATGKTLYILDEPTTGLHFADVERLLLVLHKLVAGGNTVLVIEHHLDVLKSADFIIDLGPEGGDRGGYIIGQGTVKELITNQNSYTGKYLK